MEKSSHYKHLQGYIFDEVSSNQLKRMDRSSANDLQGGDFMLQGNIYALPYAPVSKDVSSHMFYLEHYAVMEMNQNFYTKRKNYNSFLIVYTLEGKGKLEYQEQSYTLYPGDGFFIDCMQEHSYQSYGENWHHAILHLSGNAMNYYYLTFFSQGSPIFHFDNVKFFLTLLERAVDLQCSVKTNRDFYIDMTLHEILREIADHKRINTYNSDKVSETIQYLCRYMEKHFTEDLSLKSLADFCGLNPSYLCRIFKKYTSYSPKEYLTLLRLEQAKQLLRDTNIAAYKIGILVGIPNEANFIRLFKKYEKISPGEYRIRLTSSGSDA